MPASEIWQKISRYESHDYIKHFYHRLHNRNATSAQIKEINACISQGRRYFDSAGKSENSVKSLLLYYGVLALSRGAILLKGDRKREATLRASHGIEVVDWSNILSGGIGRILDASIRIGNGTFSELVEAVGNSQTCGIYRAGDGYTVEKQIFGTPSFLFDRSLISLDDIVSRDHRFFERYTAVLGRPSKTYPVSALIESGSTHFEILGGLTKTPKEIREVFHLSADLSISRRKNMMSGREIDCMYINFPFIAPGQLIDALLWIYEDEVGHYSSENFRNGDRLSVMLRTFLLSYILGMLVRYFPFRWISLLRNDVGDAAQPLLLSAMEIIEQDFPVLIDKSIWGR